MKQFIASVLLTMAAGISAVQADACKAEDLEPMLSKFFSTTWSKDCEAELKALEVDEVWLVECRKVVNSPNAAMLMEMNRRTQSTFKEVRSKDGRDYAIVEITGPEWSEFSMKTLGARVEGDCVITSNPFTQATERQCGEAFWKTVPVRTRSGALPLSCKNGKWRIVGFE